MTGPRTTEFLVIGGGPAGSAAAITLAKAGHEVVMIERSAYRGSRIGETLPPFAKPVLQRLGVCTEDILQFSLASPGTACSWGSESLSFNDALFDPDGEGLHIQRALFDSALSSQAEKNGSTVLRESRVVSGQLFDSGWRITIDGPQGCHTIWTKQLVDAAGRTGWPGRPGRRHAFDNQIAFVRFFETNQELTSPDQRTWIEAADAGWWYSSNLPDNRCIVVFFSDGDLVCRAGENRDHFWNKAIASTRWIQERLRETRPTDKLRIVSASSTLVTPIVLDRYIAVGDAASTIDPLSSQGVYYALTSAISAAEALLSFKKREAISSYARRVTERLLCDLRIRTAFCRLEKRWTDSPFWRRRQRSARSKILKYDSLHG